MAESLAPKHAEVYETPDVVEDEFDNFSQPAPVYAEDGPIVTTQFDPTDSFKKFQDSSLDTRGRDFSDSIGKPSSLSTRTTFEVIKKTSEKDTDEGAVQETPLQRYERLRAEVSGFLRDIENIRASRSQGSESNGNSGADDLEGVNLVELADRLKQWQSQLQAASKQDAGFESLRNGGSSVRNVAQSELTTQLMGKISALKNGGAEEAEVANGKGLVAYELVYRKDAAKEVKMAQVAELERRLATLEQVVTGRIAPEPETLPNQKGLLANVEDVRQKVSGLDERAMDQLSHRMVKLTKHFEALNLSRGSTDGSGSPSHSSSSSSLTPEQESKIDAVYQSLSQVEAVSAELPVVVDRLIQLRSLHEQAVHFASHLSSISSSQGELSSILKANLSGIHRMQESLTNNMATIESNVLALEKRIADVSTLLSK